MRIKVVAVGNRMPDWVNTGFQEYSRRIEAALKLELIEIPLGHRGKNPDLRSVLAKESSKIQATISPGDKVIALDVKGQSWSTERLATELGEWQRLGERIALLVGGPDGLPQDCLEQADQRWSLSALTFPHPLVRVILVEQLYRAWSILQHHPYHR